MTSTFLDLSTVGMPGDYLRRVQRGVVVKLKGKRGEFIVLKRAWKDGKGSDGLWCIPYVEGETQLESRNLRSSRGKQRDDKRSGKLYGLADVTHVRIHAGRRRRRTRSAW